MPIQRHSAGSWLGRLLQRLGFYSEREAYEYSSSMGARTRDHTRRRDAEACARVAEKVQAASRAERRKLAAEPWRVAELCAMAIRATPDNAESAQAPRAPLALIN